MPMFWNYQELTAAAEAKIRALAAKAQQDVKQYDITQQSVEDLHNQAQGCIELWEKLTALTSSEPSQIEDYQRLSELMDELFLAIHARKR